MLLRGCVKISVTTIIFVIVLCDLYSNSVNAVPADLDYIVYEQTKFYYGQQSLLCDVLHLFTYTQEYNRKASSAGKLRKLFCQKDEKKDPHLKKKKSCKQERIVDSTKKSTNATIDIKHNNKNVILGSTTTTHFPPPQKEVKKQNESVLPTIDFKNETTIKKIKTTTIQDKNDIELTTKYSSLPANQFSTNPTTETNINTTSKKAVTLLSNNSTFEDDSTNISDTNGATGETYTLSTNTNIKATTTKVQETTLDETIPQETTTIRASISVENEKPPQTNTPEDTTPRREEITIEYKMYNTDLITKSSSYPTTIDDTALTTEKTDTSSTYKNVEATTLKVQETTVNDVSHWDITTIKESVSNNSQNPSQTNILKDMTPNSNEATTDNKIYHTDGTTKSSHYLTTIDGSEKSTDNTSNLSTDKNIKAITIKTKETTFNDETSWETTTLNESVLNESNNSSETNTSENAMPQNKGTTTDNKMYSSKATVTTKLYPTTINDTDGSTVHAYTLSTGTNVEPTTTETQEKTFSNIVPQKSTTLGKSVSNNIEETLQTHALKDVTPKEKETTVDKKIYITDLTTESSFYQTTVDDIALLTEETDTSSTDKNVEATILQIPETTANNVSSWDITSIIVTVSNKSQDSYQTNGPEDISPKSNETTTANKIYHTDETTKSSHDTTTIDDYVILTEEKNTLSTDINVKTTTIKVTKTTFDNKTPRDYTTIGESTPIKIEGPLITNAPEDATPRIEEITIDNKIYNTDITVTSSPNTITNNSFMSTGKTPALSTNTNDFTTTIRVNETTFDDGTSTDYAIVGESTLTSMENPSLTNVPEGGTPWRVKTTIENKIYNPDVTITPSPYSTTIDKTASSTKETITSRIGKNIEATTMSARETTINDVTFQDITTLAESISGKSIDPLQTNSSEKPTPRIEETTMDNEINHTDITTKVIYDPTTLDDTDIKAETTKTLSTDTYVKTTTIKVPKTTFDDKTPGDYTTVGESTPISIEDPLLTNVSEDATTRPDKITVDNKIHNTEETITPSSYSTTNNDTVISAETPNTLSTDTNVKITTIEVSKTTLNDKTLSDFTIVARSIPTTIEDPSITHVPKDATPQPYETTIDKKINNTDVTTNLSHNPTTNDDTVISAETTNTLTTDKSVKTTTIKVPKNTLQNKTPEDFTVVGETTPISIDDPLLTNVSKDATTRPNKTTIDNKIHNTEETITPSSYATSNNGSVISAETTNTLTTDKKVKTTTIKVPKTTLQDKTPEDYTVVGDTTSISIDDPLLTNVSEDATTRPDKTTVDNKIHNTEETITPSSYATSNNDTVMSAETPNTLSTDTNVEITTIKVSETTFNDKTLSDFTIVAGSIPTTIEDPSITHVPEDATPQPYETTIDNKINNTDVTTNLSHNPTTNDDTVISAETTNTLTTDKSVKTTTIKVPKTTSQDKTPEDFTVVGETTPISIDDPLLTNVSEDATTRPDKTTVDSKIQNTEEIITPSSYLTTNNDTVISAETTNTLSTDTNVKVTTIKVSETTFNDKTLSDFTVIAGSIPTTIKDPLITHVPEDAKPQPYETTIDNEINNTDVTTKISHHPTTNDDTVISAETTNTLSTDESVKTTTMKVPKTTLQDKTPEDYTVVGETTPISIDDPLLTNVSEDATTRPDKTTVDSKIHNTEEIITPSSYSTTNNGSVISAETTIILTTDKSVKTTTIKVPKTTLQDKTPEDFTVVGETTPISIDDPLLTNVSEDATTRPDKTTVDNKIHNTEETITPSSYATSNNDTVMSAETPNTLSTDTNVEITTIKVSETTFNDKTLSDFTIVAGSIPTTIEDPSITHVPEDATPQPHETTIDNEINNTDVTTNLSHNPTTNDNTVISAETTNTLTTDKSVKTTTIKVPKTTSQDKTPEDFTVVGETTPISIDDPLLTNVSEDATTRPDKTTVDSKIQNTEEIITLSSYLTTNNDTVISAETTNTLSTDTNVKVTTIKVSETTFNDKTLSDFTVIAGSIPTTIKDPLITHVPEDATPQPYETTIDNEINNTDVTTKISHHLTTNNDTVISAETTNTLSTDESVKTTTMKVPKTTLQDKTPEDYTVVGETTPISIDDPLLTNVSEDATTRPDKTTVDSKIHNTEEIITPSSYSTTNNGSVISAETTIILTTNKIVKTTTIKVPETTLQDKTPEDFTVVGETTPISIDDPLLTNVSEDATTRPDKTTVDNKIHNTEETITVSSYATSNNDTVMSAETPNTLSTDTNVKITTIKVSETTFNDKTLSDFTIVAGSIPTTIEDPSITHVPEDATPQPYETTIDNKINNTDVTTNLSHHLTTNDDTVISAETTNTLTTDKSVKTTTIKVPKTTLQDKTPKDFTVVGETTPISIYDPLLTNVSEDATTRPDKTTVDSKIQNTEEIITPSSYLTTNNDTVISGETTNTLSTDTNVKVTTIKVSETTFNDKTLSDFTVIAGSIPTTIKDLLITHVPEDATPQPYETTIDNEINNTDVTTKISHHPTTNYDTVISAETTNTLSTDESVKTTTIKVPKTTLQDKTPEDYTVVGETTPISIDDPLLTNVSEDATTRPDKTTVDSKIYNTEEIITPSSYLTTNNGSVISAETTIILTTDKSVKTTTIKVPKTTLQDKTPEDYTVVGETTSISIDDTLLTNVSEDATTRPDKITVDNKIHNTEETITPSSYATSNNDTVMSAETPNTLTTDKSVKTTTIKVPKTTLHDKTPEDYTVVGETTPISIEDPLLTNVSEDAMTRPNKTTVDVKIYSSEETITPSSYLITNNDTVISEKTTNTLSTDTNVKITTINFSETTFDDRTLSDFTNVAGSTPTIIEDPLKTHVPEDATPQSYETTIDNKINNTDVTTKLSHHPTTSDDTVISAEITNTLSTDKNVKTTTIKVSKITVQDKTPEDYTVVSESTPISIDDPLLTNVSEDATTRPDKTTVDVKSYDTEETITPSSYSTSNNDTVIFAETTNTPSTDKNVKTTTIKVPKTTLQDKTATVNRSFIETNILGYSTTLKADETTTDNQIHDTDVSMKPTVDLITADINARVTEESFSTIDSNAKIFTTEASEIVSEGVTSVEATTSNKYTLITNKDPSQTNKPDDLTTSGSKEKPSDITVSDTDATTKIDVDITDFKASENIHVEKTTMQISETTSQDTMLADVTKSSVSSITENISSLQTDPRQITKTFDEVKSTTQNIKYDNEVSPKTSLSLTTVEVTDKVTANVSGVTGTEVSQTKITDTTSVTTLSSPVTIKNNNHSSVTSLQNSSTTESDKNPIYKNKNDVELTTKSSINTVKLESNDQVTEIHNSTADKNVKLTSITSSSPSTTQIRTYSPQSRYITTRRPWRQRIPHRRRPHHPYYSTASPGRRNCRKVANIVVCTSKLKPDIEEIKYVSS